MKIKLTFILALLFLFLGFRVVQAQVVINEVELNPTGARFIELYNEGNQTVDLSGWYLQRKTENQTDFGSLVSKTNFKGKVIGPNGYFLISRGAMQNADIVQGALTLTESNTIQLKNSKGMVIDKISWGDASTNIPNPPDGESIQKMTSGWIVASPTPRAPNIVSISVPVQNIPPVANILVVPPIVPIAPEPKPKPKIIETKSKTEVPKIKTKIVAEPKKNLIDPIDPTYLVATPPSEESYFFWGGLVVLLIVSGGAIYFIRRRKNISKVGDNFKIIDK